MKNTNYKALVLLAVLFVSFSPILTKLSTSPALIIAAYRLAITVLFMFPFIIFKKNNDYKNMDIKLLLLSILSGIFLAFHFVSWILSIKYTSITSSTVLVSIHPVFIIFLNFFIFKEKPKKYIIISILISIIGSIIIAFGDSTAGSNELYGDVLAIFGAVFMSGYLIIGKIVRQRISSSTYTFVVYLSSTITLIILGLINNVKLYPYPIKEILIFIALAIFATILGHSIFSYTLKFLNPAFISTTTLAEPVFATIWALIIFSEIPTVYNITGGLLVILGISLFVMYDKKDTINK